MSDASVFNQATGEYDTLYNPSSNDPASGVHGPAEEDTAENNAIEVIEHDLAVDYAQLQSQAVQISTLQTQVATLDSQVANLQGSTSTPTEVAPPIVTGTYTVGSILQCSQGTWTGGPGITFQWLRNSTSITGATSASYTIQSVDISDILTCRVTATNNIGPATYITTNSTAVSASTPPALTAYSPPTAMTVGTPVSYQFTASGTTPITFSASGQLPAGLSLQPSGLFSGTPVSAGTVSFTVTASGVGTPAVSPTITIVVSVVVPTNAGIPVVTGSDVVGQTLTTTYGTWNNSPQTYAIVWKSNGTVITNATAATYVLQSSDIGNTITSTVTATNSGGSAASTSAGVGPVVAGVVRPANSVLPTLSGTFIVGDTITASTGTWSGSPSYTYQWDHAGVAIAGATGSYYVLAVGDQGDMITVTVTATNTAGATTVTSAAYGPVTAAVSPPANSVPPQISGNLYVGNVLTATTGSWAGSPGYTYQWQVTPSGGSLTNIPNATGSTYTVDSAYSGAAIDVTVTGTNAAGSATATSAAVTISTITAPVNLTLPVLSTNSPVVGQPISVSNGTWQGQVSSSPTISSLSPTSGPAGINVTIAGANFGTTQGSSYVQFQDAGVSWGAPGNTATFVIVSWSATSIVFTVPVTSNGFSVTNGTTATVQVYVSNNGSNVASFAVSSTSGNAKMSTLTDPFTSSSTLSTTWSLSNTYAPVPTISSGVASVTYAGSYPQLASGANYDLTGSSLVAQMGVNTTNAGNQGTIALNGVTGYQLVMQVNGTTLVSNVQTNGTTVTGTSVTYNATNHKWWKIVNTTGTTVLFQTSPDGINWTTLNTGTCTFLTTLQVGFQAGSYSGTAAGALTVQNLNTPPATNLLTGAASTFEGGVGGWVATSNCTVASSTAYAHSGTSSLALTCTTAGQVGSTCNAVAVTPGEVITPQAWIYNGVPSSGDLLLSFLTSSYGYVSGTSDSFAAPAAQVWTQVIGTAHTVPAGATLVNLELIFLTQNVGNVQYVDDAAILSP
jgi:hypothetical protein